MSTVVDGNETLAQRSTTGEGMEEGEGREREVGGEGERRWRRQLKLDRVSHGDKKEVEVESL